MPAYKSHGKTYVQPDAPDELTEGVPVRALDQTGDVRRANGTFEQGSKWNQAKGGKASKGQPKLATALTAPKLDPKHRKAATNLRTALRAEIAATVGAGVCGIAGSLLIKFCAQKTAAAEQAYEAGDYETHRKLSESARMDLVYARELEAKAAQSRPKPRVDVLAKWLTPEQKANIAAHEAKRLEEKKVTP
jgi:hypothetical protein